MKDDPEAPVDLPDLRHVQIQTVSRCNADCVFCPYVESWHAAHPGRMDDPLWRKILDDLQPFAAGLSRGSISPYLMNEPLLDPLLFRRIADIYEAFPRTMVTVATNGAALTPRNAERLLGALDGRKHQIWVSHHGVDATSMHEIMRLDYDRALDNLIGLLRAAQGRFRIQIRGAGTHRDGRKAWFSPEDYRLYWKHLFAAHDVKTDKVHVDAFTFHDRAGTLRRDERGASGLSVGVVREIGPDNPFHCRRLDQWAHVLWDGTLRLCCMDYPGEVPLPSLRDTTLVDYLRSPIYQDLSDRVTGRVESPPNFLCKRCLSPGG